MRTRNRTRGLFSGGLFSPVAVLPERYGAVSFGLLAGALLHVRGQGGGAAGRAEGAISGRP